jgi:hypothetical protein
MRRSTRSSWLRRNISVRQHRPQGLLQQHTNFTLWITAPGHAERQNYIGRHRARVLESNLRHRDGDSASP